MSPSYLVCAYLCYPFESLETDAFSDACFIIFSKAINGRELSPQRIRTFLNALQTALKQLRSNISPILKTAAFLRR